MGSLARKLKRNQQRLAFDNFTKVFMAERRYQEHLVAEESERQLQAMADDGVVDPSKISVNVKNLFGGNPQLGKKPGFTLWRRSVEMALARAANEAAAKKAEVDAADKKDLEWKDE